MDANSVEHLKLIQGVVSRMATTSFVLKGWSLTVAAVLLGLAADKSNSSLALLAIAAVAAFWSLDAYYLRQERLFRALYDAVRAGRVTGPFSMDRSEVAHTVKTYLATLIAPTILVLHGMTIAVAIAVAIAIQGNAGAA